VGSGSYQTDMSGMARVHGIVEKELGAAPRYVHAASQPDRVAAVASFYENLLEYIHVHHGSEDALLYPRLEERCPDDLDSIQRVWAQHQLLEAPMAAARDALDQWRKDPDAGRTSLSDAIGTVLEVLTPHCRDEEAVIVPLGSRYLSEAEDAELRPYEQQHYRADKPWLMLGLALEGFDEAHRTPLLAALPEARRIRWTDEWSPAFQALMSLVRP